MAPDRPEPADRDEPPANAEVSDGPDRARDRAHAAAVERGDDGYLDPQSGLFVLTAAYLEQRGYCCGEGCRHCPF